MKRLIENNPIEMPEANLRSNVKEIKESFIAYREITSRFAINTAPLYQLKKLNNFVKSDPK